MKESKPLPKLLQWPWCVIVYGVLLVLLRLFAVPIIAVLVAVQRKYSPHGAQEGYCLAKTRKRLVRLAVGLPLLALAAACFWFSQYAPEEERKELWMVLAMGAVAAVAGLYLSVTAVRDSFFPEKSALAASIRSQLPHPEEAPPVGELFAMVDSDLREHGLWFGPVGVGDEWVLGTTEANYLPRLCGVYTIDRMVRNAARKPAREMALVLIDDRFQLHRTDFLSSPQDLQAAADAIALRAPDAVRGQNDDYRQLLYMKEEQQEQFLRERRRRTGERAASEARRARQDAAGGDHAMTLTLADGTATSRLDDDAVAAALDRCLDGGADTVFFLTPARPLDAGGTPLAELECQIWPQASPPVTLLAKVAPANGGIPTAGFVKPCVPAEAKAVLLAWRRGEAPALDGWDAVSLAVGQPGPRPDASPAMLWLEGPEGRQQFTDFSDEDVALAADGLADGTYTFAGYSGPGGLPFFYAEAGDETDGRCRVRAAQPAGGQGGYRVYETRMSARQAAEALRAFRAGRLQRDRSWKDVTKEYQKA